MKPLKHSSHINSIEGLFEIFPTLQDFLKNPEGSDYEDWSNYINWINNQYILLKESFKKLNDGYSYASIMPVIREVYENFWFIDLAMNGIKHYKWFDVKKGHDINKIYNKWEKDLEDSHRKGEFKEVLEVSKTKKRIRVTYIGIKINFLRKGTSELVPFYHFLIDDYDPIEAYLGKEKKVIENYLTPPHRFGKFVTSHKNLHDTYFDFRKGIVPHLLLNNLITEKEMQRIIIHYNFLSLWSHPNQFAFREATSNFNCWTKEKRDNDYLDRLILLYIGNLGKMFLDSFFRFLKRQEKEGKALPPKKEMIDEANKKIKNLEQCFYYFWFIFNNPSRFYKYNYAIHKIWRQAMFQKNMNKFELSKIKDSEIPYYKNPLDILKSISQSCDNVLVGSYKCELNWE